MSTGTTTRRLTVQDAHKYLDKLRAEFKFQPWVYNEFLEIMKKFKSKSVDTHGSIKLVVELFKGNRSFMLGFLKKGGPVSLNSLMIISTRHPRSPPLPPRAAF